MDEKNEADDKGLKSHFKWNQRKGGFRAAAFIYVMTGLESMSFVANATSLVIYFLKVLFFHPSSALTTVTNFMGSTMLLSVVGGFISDTYLSRLNTCIAFGILEILGLAMLATQAHFKNLRPPRRCRKSRCLHGNAAVMFYSTLCLLALGSGGVRGALPALGADQFDQKDPKERKQMASFFNFLLLSITIGAAIGVTAIVWIMTNKGWDLGFFISMLCALSGFAVLIFGMSFYRGRAPGDSPIIRILQVIVVAFRNRSLSLPGDSDELYEIHDKENVAGEKIPPTNQLRALNKAAILQEGFKPEPWKVCTVTQVEEVKILAKMLPIIASTIIMNTCLAQLQTLSIEQGNYMDLSLGKIEFPAASIPVIPLVFMSILIPIYEFTFVPFARKITGHPSGITQLQRVGVGLVLSAISMTVAGFVELKRRNAWNHHQEQISLFWLSFQFSIFGIADMFTLVGLIDFFYSEAPVGMRSLSTSFSWLSMSFGYFLSSAFVGTINFVTSRVTKSRKGWLQGEDLNQTNANLFYWFLAILSTLNFLVYLFCAKWYKYKANFELVEEKKEMSMSGAPSYGEKKSGGSKGQQIPNTSAEEHWLSTEQKPNSSIEEQKPSSPTPVEEPKANSSVQEQEANSSI